MIAALRQRFLKRDVLFMFIRNTVVSCGVFVVGLAVLWLLVEQAGVDQVLAAGISFVVANSLHYVGGRAWIYPGTERTVGRGYAYFLMTGGVGLALTVLLFAAMVRWTPVHYLAARVLVSVVAGMAMFAINATLNFRRV